MRDRLMSICNEKINAMRFNNSDHWFDFYERVEELADYLLANGVIVQKQGEWKKTKEPLGWQDVDCVECSACHETWILDEDFDFEFCKEVWKYCPNCGVKIKEREGK